MISIDFTVNEKSAIEVNISFTDSSGTIHGIEAMSSARFQLSDIDGNIINERTFDNGLIASNPVILSGEDLALTDSGPCRIFAVKIIYTSTYGSELFGTEEKKFKINDLVNI